MAEPMNANRRGITPAAALDPKYTFSRSIARDDTGLPLLYGYLNDSVTPTGLIASSISDAATDMYGIKYAESVFELRHACMCLCPL